MMRGSHSRLTTGVSSASSALEIYASALYGFYLREIEIYLTAATASTYSVRRTTTLGITPGTIHGIPVEASPNPTVITALNAITWGTQPVVASARWTCVLAAAIGQTAKKSWSDFYIPKGGSVVLYNDAANGAVQVNFTIDEDR